MNTTDICFPSNKVADIIRCFHTTLDDKYPKNEVDNFILLLFEKYLNWDHAKFLINKHTTINQSSLLNLHWAMKDLEKERPIQHIIGRVEFCGCTIKVTPDVLIPRPETEEMVNRIITEHRGQSNLSILDLCTGSGCIATALSKNLDKASVTAVDISSKAVSVALENAEANKQRIRFITADILNSGIEDILGNQKYDIIVSNPPYVCDNERKKMRNNVLMYEPHIALFVPDDNPLLFYKTIVDLSKILLKDNTSQLVVEINETKSEEVQALMSTNGLSPQLLYDFRGVPRCVSAHKK